MASNNVCDSHPRGNSLSFFNSWRSLLSMNIESTSWITCELSFLRSSDTITRKWTHLHASNWLNAALPQRNAITILSLRQLAIKASFSRAHSVAEHQLVLLSLHNSAWGALISAGKINYPAWLGAEATNITTHFPRGRTTLSWQRKYACTQVHLARHAYGPLIIRSEGYTNAEKRVEAGGFASM